MKSLDIVVLCKLLLLEQRNMDWSYKFLSEEVILSASETHASVKRLIQSSVFDELSKSVIKSSMEELLINGVKYVFPAEKGSLVRGIPTAHSAPILNEIFSQSSEDKYVWPSAEGSVKGISIQPLSKTVPQAVLKDVELYNLLALIDTLRIGRARERKIAEEMIKKIYLEINVSKY